MSVSSKFSHYTHNYPNIHLITGSPMICPKKNIKVMKTMDSHHFEESYRCCQTGIHCTKHPPKYIFCLHSNDTRRCFNTSIANQSIYSHLLISSSFQSHNQNFSWQVVLPTALAAIHCQLQFHPGCQRVPHGRCREHSSSWPRERPPPSPSL